MQGLWLHLSGRCAFSHRKTWLYESFFPTGSRAIAHWYHSRYSPFPSSILGYGERYPETLSSTALWESGSEWSGMHRH